jgi:Mrp family chromosome partitioning ATPase
VKLPPYRVALAVGEPNEARLLALLEDPGFQVGGRACVVSTFCSTIREVREALGRADSIDVVVLSSTLQAMPSATLEALVTIGRPLVVAAPDPTAPRWSNLPVPVLGLDTDDAGLAATVGEAVLGYGSSRRRTASGAPPPAAASRVHTAPLRIADSAGQAPQPGSSEVISITCAETHDGATSVSVSVAYALSFVGPTVLLDVNARGSGVEFHLPVDPARGLPQLGRRAREGRAWQQTFEDDGAWQTALESELQSMGPRGQGWVACGISTPAYREYLTASLVERVIGTLRSSRRFIVLDGSGSGWAAGDADVDRAALHAADRLLVVLRPDEQGIERTRRVLGDANQHLRERVGLVLNQVGLPGTDEAVGIIEYTLRAPVVAVLPFDARHVAAARAHHHPVVCEPGCRLSAPLLGLASRLAGGGPIRVPTSNPSIRGPLPWWRRLAVAPAALFR